MLDIQASKSQCQHATTIKCNAPVTKSMCARVFGGKNMCHARKSLIGLKEIQGENEVARQGGREKKRRTGFRPGVGALEQMVGKENREAKKVMYCCLSLPYFENSSSEEVALRLYSILNRSGFFQLS